MLKRALIITYYWPPAGGPGVQRWLKFVKYFRDFGIEPVVYIPENPHYPLLDESFISEIPSDTEILQYPVKEPYRFAGMLSKKKTNTISKGIITKKEQTFMEQVMLFVRGNFFIPDARVGWVKPSVAFLQKQLSGTPVDCIITTGPPHSLHLIGMQLQEALQLPWIADFRDPWTTIHYHKELKLSNAAARKHKRMEAEVLRKADRIVVTSPTTKKEFEVITETPIEVITNGYEISEAIAPVPDVSFSIAHIGSLLSERNPKVLWNVLSEIASEDPSFASALEIKLVGSVSETVIASIEAAGLEASLRVIDYVSHSEALEMQHNAQVLLVVEMDRPETRAILPGKLFECLAARRPIIALGPEGSDIEEILNQTKSGHFFGYQNKAQLKEVLLAHYKDFTTGNLVVHSEGIAHYSRRELTKKMAALIISTIG